MGKYCLNQGQDSKKSIKLGLILYKRIAWFFVPFRPIGTYF